MSAPVLRKIIYSVVILSWIATMSALIDRHYRPFEQKGPASKTVVLPAESYGDQWMGVYFKNKKIGHVHRRLERAGTGYTVSETAKMRLIVMESPKEIETETSANLAADLSLVSFRAAFRGDADLKISGEVNGKTLRMVLETSGVRTIRTVRLNDNPSLSLSLVPQMLRSGIATGRRFSVGIIDPSSFAQEQVPVEITGREKITVMGANREVFRLKGMMKGADFSIWLTERGEVLKEESTAGFTLIKETKEEALSHIGIPADLTEQVAVPFNMKLPCPVRYLRIRISGIDQRDFELEGGGQHINDGVLEIKMEDLAIGRGGGAKEMVDTPQYLRESTSVQSKDQRIISLSRDIVKGQRDPTKAARLIYDWVYRNIEKVPSVTFPDAVAVLKTRKGDCNEHTTLYTALSRAAGIPTRMAAGLVYREGKFYYHAWPEIFSGKWVAIDPTLGQFPADAAHIRLIAGDIDSQIRLIAIIGKIRIEGLQYR